MNRNTAIFVIFVLWLALIGCGANKPEARADSSSAQNATQQGDTVTTNDSTRWTFPESEKLPEDRFWALIANHQPIEGGCQDAMETLSLELSKLPDSDILGFECTFRELVMRLYRYDVLGAATLTLGWVSDDGFLYYRCGVIAAGRAVYEATIANPDNLADYPDIEECEDLLYVADDAWAVRHGKDSDDRPRFQADRRFSYDLPDGDLMGEDWGEDDLPKILPRLWARHGG